jgi:hypothetical protein
MTPPLVLTQISSWSDSARVVPLELRDPGVIATDTGQVNQFMKFSGFRSGYPSTEDNAWYVDLPVWGAFEVFDGFGDHFLKAINNDFSPDHHVKGEITVPIPI